MTSAPLLLPASPAALLGAGLPAVALALLSWGVLLHGLHKLRCSDSAVALAWWLGLSLAVGSGLTGAPLLGAAALAPASSGSALLSLDTLGTLWAVSVGAVSLLLLLARQVDSPWPRRAGQGALLGLHHWLVLQITLQALNPQAEPPLPSPWGLAGPALGALVLALGSVAALGLTGARHTRAGFVVVGLSCALAQGLSWPALDLQPLAMAPSERWLDALTLRLLVASAGLTLLLGSLVSQVDRRAHGQGLRLSRSLSQAHDKLREQALMDPLTRLPNRLNFEERLDEALLRIERTSERQPGSEASLAVLFLDLDGFKPINDSFGHVAGDAVLQEMARRLRSAIRPGDLVARVGGDEFLALCEQPGGETGAAEVARRLLTLCSQPCVLPNRVEIKLSCSIGIVMFPQFGPAPKLIAQADAAMYAAKRAGGATFAFYEPRMEQDARNQLGLQSDLRAALERQELELYYQPKIDGRSNQITGVEALVRWHHPQRGLVMPGLFIPIAERFGLIGRLGDWVIEESCRQLSSWRDQGLRMRVALNMSAHQLRDPELLPRMAEAMRRHGVEPAQLTIEIIESVLMDDAAVRSFAGLASLGVGLSIDDFGIGYCNFALLRKLPVKQLKVDRSLFVDVNQSADARAVVIAIVRMAHALSLRVVAEGVETPEQRDLLLELQCDELQGYLFAKPMSAAKLTLWAMSDEHKGPADASAPSSAGAFRPSTFLDAYATLRHGRPGPTSR